MRTLFLSLPVSLVSSAFLFSNPRSFRVSSLHLQIGTSTFLRTLPTPKWLNFLLSLLSFKMPASLPAVQTLVSCLPLPWAVLPFPLSSLSFLPPSSSTSFTHQTIWSPSIPSKFQASLWKVAWNRAPTLNIIQTFNPNLTPLPNVCPFVSLMSNQPIIFLSIAS